MSDFQVVIGTVCKTRRCGRTAQISLSSEIDAVCVLCVRVCRVRGELMVGARSYKIADKFLKCVFYNTVITTLQKTHTK